MYCRTARVHSFFYYIFKGWWSFIGFHFFIFPNQVWQMEWDMSGMTLATTGDGGVVRLWQSNLNGVWQEQAAFEITT